MPKFLFLKKNKAPLPDDLNPQPLSPSLVWATIIGLFSIFTIFIILFSALLLWKIMNEDSAASNRARPSSVTSINKEKLKNAAEAIKNRPNSD